MYFGMKNYLKSTRNHTAKHAQNLFLVEPEKIIFILVENLLLF